MTELKLCLVFCATLVFFALAGCPKPAPGPTPPDTTEAMEDGAIAGGDTGATCERACGALATAKCPEGDDHDRCVAVCRHVLDTHLTELPAECLASATSSAAVKACGVKCER
jgi:hypothetical protein